MAEENRLLELIERLGGLIRAAVRACAAEHGLQPVHIEILRYLSRCNRFSDTPQAIAAYLGTTKGSISQSIQRLEARRLVAKRADPDDRRRVHVRPTAHARELLDACRLPDALREAAGRLDAELLASTAAVLTRLLRELQLGAGRRTFGQCRTCRHLQQEGMQYRCGLTGEPLTAPETESICYEHAPRATGT